MKTSVLGANDEYVQQNTLYERKDALFAILLFVVINFLFVFLGEIFIHNISNITGIFVFCATGIVSLACIGLVLLFCKLRKQKLVTIGFSMKQAIRSFIIGITLVVIIVVFFIIIKYNVVDTIKNKNTSLIIMNFVYYLIFIAFMEEIIIRGYIGTRLYGYFRNKRLSIFIVGIMFTMYHIPFQMIISQMSFLEYIAANWNNLIGILIFHYIFQWLYSKYNSIIAPTMLHFIWDFMQWLFSV